MTVFALVPLILGVALEGVAVLGLVVMRTAYERLHYLGVAGYGALLIAVAIVIRESFSLVADKALLAAAVLVLGGVVTAHVTARSLLVRERGDWRCAGEDHT